MPTSSGASGGAVLEVEGLSKSFGGLVAVHDVSVSVARGEILGVIGPNGAGKTTLFGLISGFIKPTAGRVAFKGHPITGLPPHRIVQLGLTRSFQIVQLFADMTVLEAVTAAALLRNPMREAIRKAEAVLERIGLADIRHEVPTALSLQDKKLLEVAKCLATEPELILLDEVMAGLTLAEAQAPMRVIRDLQAGGIAFVMVEHVMPIVMSVADRLLVLNFGQKIADGTPAEIVANPAVREAYFGEEVVDA
jgi:branched-chain amino acid transport system ATP-binding protein